MEIKLHRKIKLDPSVMIAGWPGMGSVATDTVNYIRRKMNARFFAGINPKNAHIPEGVIVNRGAISMPAPPQTSFYYRKTPAVTFLEGSAQFRGPEAFIFLNKVLDVAQMASTDVIITSAAFPSGITHRDEPEIYYASNSQSLSRDLKKTGLKPLRAGQISGLNGLILSRAKTRGIDAACLLATIPQYAAGIPNPRAVLEIADFLAHLLDADIDLAELEETASEMDRRLDAVESGVKDLMGRPQYDDAGTGGDEGREVPGRVIEKIEKLFDEAKISRQKAVQLKEELDRWDLYPVYEDRFLDLFKKTN